MKLSEYMQKQKEQKEVDAAKKRYEQAQEKLKEERRKWRREHPNIIVKQFKSLKPWTRSDVVLLVLMLILFSFAYFKDDFGFSFSLGGNDLEKLSASVVDKSADLTEEDQKEAGADSAEEEIIEDSTEEESSTEQATTESKNPVEFTLKATYNNKEFTSLSLPNGTSIVNYYLVFDNKEFKKIRCEGFSSYLTKDIPSNFFIDSGKEKSVWAKVTAEESNKKVVVKNEFDCYEEGKKDETLSEQSLRLTFHFGELS